MLLDFTVENYRSIKEPVTLSAVAQKPSRRKTKESSNRKGIKSDHEIAPGYYVEGWDIEVLPVLAIFGANASGKSNVIQALDYLLMMMTYGIQETVKHQRIFKYAKLDPFKLDSISAKQPTKFELRTLFDNNIYTYTLEINQNRVISEKLDYALNTTKRTRRLFNRQWNDNTNKFIWKTGDDFAGPHNQLQDKIKENELYINILSKLEVNTIKPLIDWLEFRWIGIHLGSEEMEVTIIKSMQHMNASKFQEKIAPQVFKIIKKFDTGLSKIEINKTSEEDFDYNIYAFHNTIEGHEIQWLLEEESLGTQRLFSLAFRIVITLISGSLTIVDELGTNIHPNIVKYIIKIFQNPKTNPKNAQLIFTSHDNTLQRNNLLRRDQIWFTQKRPDHSTELYPLTDFHVRNDLAIDKAYLDGRFGAVPFLPSDEEMILQGDEEWPES
ncbi:ATP-binding protein [Sphaerospermopsis aphanizomenoides BCCUSP55]|uniref:AAA family ATPase n=1 Tax=Sphaerospermopsis aphanizomenoides TaxID=459663 RepID=UPI001907994D|nr:ATP-binding protein [Sphaerospermopsis aphanizomenoides]MBK1989651.1 ATP-binding protein [Sphaerospermopsis aphanizomenoides BCCUSP55]